MSGHPPSAARDPVAPRRAGASLPAVLARAPAVRDLGPTALQVAQVGSGHLEAFREYGPNAGNLPPVAAEAGAVVTDALGAPWTPATDGGPAAAPGLHGELLRVLTPIVRHRPGPTPATPSPGGRAGAAAQGPGGFEAGHTASALR